LNFFPKKINDFYTKVGFSGFFQLPIHPKNPVGKWVVGANPDCISFIFFDIKRLFNVQGMI
jgi:hypothetical protein